MQLLISLSLLSLTITLAWAETQLESMPPSNLSSTSATEPSNSIFERMLEHRLMLWPEQRQKINQARTEFLNELLNSKVESSQIDSTVKSVSKKKRIQKTIRRYLLQSVIVNAQGEAQIQLNNRWFKQQNSPIHFKVDPADPTKVQLQVGKKQFIVPVGASIFVDKQKVTWKRSVIIYLKSD